MHLQAVFDAASLKPLTRALTCISKYGDEVTVYGTPEMLSLSATNSSKSAYCRFRYAKSFFSKYSINKDTLSGRRGPYADDSEEMVKGTIPTKVLLGVLKNRSSDKSVEKCELSITEGNAGAEEDQDSLESRLIVRLHCKHGIVKTHRLTLNDIESLLAPGITEQPDESRLLIGPKTLKDMIDQLPSSKSGKSDPQLSWTFGDSKVQVKSHDSSMESRAALSTELSFDSEEFDEYTIFAAPVSFAFHLREFSASIAYAESMTVGLDLHFTEPGAPLYIDAESDNIGVESLFVISTSHTRGGAPQPSQMRSSASSTGKRSREPDSAADRIPERRRPQKIVERTDAAALAKQIRDRQSMPPPSLPFARAGAGADQREREPLFLPSSQLSQADEQALRDSGLGDMNADDFNAMFDDEGVEVGEPMAVDDESGAPPPSFRAASLNFSPEPEARARGESFELIEEELGPTQQEELQSSADRAFQPLFDD